jgi:hypothetical protein
MLAPTGGQIALWAADHMGLLGWPALLGLVWKFRGTLDEFFSFQKEMEARIKSTELMATQVLGGVDTIKTNHLRHIEDNFKDLTVKQDKSHDVLVSIDKNIAVLLTAVTAGRKID